MLGELIISCSTRPSKNTRHLCFVASNGPRIRSSNGKGLLRKTRKIISVSLCGRSVVISPVNVRGHCLVFYSSLFVLFFSFLRVSWQGIVKHRTFADWKFEKFNQSQRVRDYLRKYSLEHYWVCTKTFFRIHVVSFMMYDVFLIPVP